MMKCLIASVAIVILPLSAAGTQETCRQEGTFDVPPVIGSTVGALIGASVGYGHGRTVATAAGGLLGGVLGNSLLPRRPRSTNTLSLVSELRKQRDQVIEAVVKGEIPMPRKPVPAGSRK